MKGLTGLGFIFAKTGKIDKSLEIIEKFKNREKLEKECSFSVDFAIIYTGMSDYDNAFYYLNKAVDEKFGGAVFLKSSLFWKDLRKDARFNEVLKKVGLA